MKNFLRDMNVARFIILFCLLSSLWLGWNAWVGYEKNENLKTALNPNGQVENLVTEIQVLSKQHTQLMEESKNDALTGQSNPESYIRKQAADPNIELGQLKIVPSDKPLSKGIVDKQYRITPQSRDRDFGKLAIANFFFKLEADSPRVRVTDLEIETSENRLGHGEFPSDKWKFNAQITSRQRIE